MTKDNLSVLQSIGQSVWLDNLSRSLIDSGRLQRLVSSGLGGITSNPAIFEKAINGGNDYDTRIHELGRAGHDPETIYRTLVVADIAAAADILHPVYEASKSADGFVSLEVSPHLARDTEGTITEARELWQAVDRRNVMIKVPGTHEGLPAVSTLIEEGINVNVTLLFGLDRYGEVYEAYMEGLEKRARAGHSLQGIASVASFFLSRIDTVVDPLLDQAAGPEAGQYRGQTAIACAKLAYRHSRSVLAGRRFQGLAELGAQQQRLLWASTGTKNPDYADTHYVEPLIGPDTVNTLPEETLEAFIDHGTAGETLAAGVDEAEQLLRRLPELDIHLDAITRQLEEEGIRKFTEPYDRLLDSIATKAAGK
ncbi:MAG: transaldolase [Pseudohongiellaceae bacterium]